MDSSEIRDKYIKFFESKGHKQIPSAPVVPENDHIHMEQDFVTIKSV